MNSHGNISDPITVAVLKEIVDTLRWEKEHGHVMSPLDIFKSPFARKRLLIGMSPGPVSCTAGNIASYYFGSGLDTVGITNTNDQLKAVSLFSIFQSSVCQVLANEKECGFKCLAPCMLSGRHTSRCQLGRKPTAILSQALLITCLFIIGSLSKEMPLILQEHPTTLSVEMWL